jgi:MSHA biogenesis protein MshQ
MKKSSAQAQRILANVWLFFVAVLLMVASGAAAAVTVTASPTTCSNTTGVGTVVWGTPGNAVSTNASYATAVVDGSTSQYLLCTNYGFAIPVGAMITGVTVNVTRRSDSTSNGGSQDAAMRLVKAGTPGATDRSTTTVYTTADVVEAHGSAIDLWGTTWTPAEINAANFGAAFATTKASNGGAAHTVRVDHIQITVDYFLCTPPSNVPAGVTVSCSCDVFARSTLNPSTIFGANWIVSASDSTGIVPSIVNPGYLRLTDNTGNNAKAATVPGIFPASGNYISVEFQQYAYNGSVGADGIALTLSDYAVTAVPGAFGGSLGYAPKVPPAVPSNVPGFAGGWIGVALDEYGNFQNPTEGRTGGPGVISQSVGVRGSGTGVTGYNWLTGTNGLNPLIDDSGSTTPSRGFYYQVIVDARTPASTSIAVNRDTGAGYTSLINVPNIFTAATAQGFTQAPVPSNWQISFTGSTGGSTNIHEISGLKICAQTSTPPVNGTASGLNAVDEGYGTPPSVTSANYNTGHIYTKLVGTAFKLNVAALSNNQILTNYVVSGSKTVTLKLVDNADGACILNSVQANYCNSTCTSKAAVTGGSQTMTFTSADAGQRQSANFTLNTAYPKLAVIINDGTTTACSTDAFSVRPASIVSVTSSNATNTGTSGTPRFKAGSDTFALTATTTGVAGNPSGYTGVIQLSPTAAVSPIVLAPTNFPAAIAGTPSSTATSSSFTYSEVGTFQLSGYPVTDATSIRGAYDSTWTAIDSPDIQGDCIVDSYSNTKDADGKYGCNFGLINTATFGRFIPHHFAVTGNVTAACTTGPTSFTYMGQPFATMFQVTAQNAMNETTKNYAGTLAKLDGSTVSKWTALAANDSLGLWAMGSNIGGNATCTAKFALTTPFTTTRTCDTAVAATAARVAVSGTPTGIWAAGVGTFNGNVVLNRASAVDGSYETFQIGVAPQDADGVQLLPAALDLDADATVGNERARIATTVVRYGRMRLSNAYGSELLPLTVPFTAQYFQSGTGWVSNTDDGCSQVAVPANGSGLTFYTQTTKNQLAATEVFARMRNAPDTADVTAGGTGFLHNGAGNFRLTGATGATVGPGAGNFGYVDITPTVDTWLQFNWTGTVGNPTVRASFGTYKSPVIYLRENY